MKLQSTLQFFSSFAVAVCLVFDSAVSQSGTNFSEVATTEHIFTCRNRCGQALKVPCSCDPACVVFDFCCENMETDCPLVLAEGRKKFSHLLQSDTECLAEGFFVISSCPHSEMTGSTNNINPTTATSASTDTMAYLESLLGNTLVTDASTNFSYLNSYIFSCNGGNLANQIEWKVVARFNPSEQDFTLNYLKQLARITYEPPQTLSESAALLLCHHRSHEILCMQPQLQLLCESFTSYVVASGKIYRNRHCAVCNEVPEGGFFPALNESKLSGKSYFPGFSVVLALSSSRDVKIDFITSKSDLFKPSWTSIKCSINSSNQENRSQSSRRLDMTLQNLQPQESDNLCQVKECNTWHELRSDGLCKKKYDIFLSFPTEEFPLTPAESTLLPQYLQCCLDKFVEIDTKLKSEPPTIRFDINLNRTVHFLSLNVYTKDSELKYLGYLDTLKLIRLSVAVKALKQHVSTNPQPPCDSRDQHNAFKNPSRRYSCPGSRVANLSTLDSLESQSLLALDPLPSSQRGKVIDNAKVTFCQVARSGEINESRKLLCLTEPWYETDQQMLADFSRFPCLSVIKPSSESKNKSSSRVAALTLVLSLVILSKAIN